MRKHMMALAGAAVTVATVLALGADLALAAGTWTVTNGGILNFKQVSAPILKDVSSGDSLTCSGVVLTIDIPDGTGLNGAGDRPHHAQQL